jgi:Fic family protein
LESYAGNWRPAGVAIKKSKHVPPGAHLVPEYVEFLCDYVNDNWSATPLHLSAYIMWRLNWIHPFADGNGRTSRILSYVILRAGYVVPGAPTIPDLIKDHRSQYFAALDAADDALTRTERHIAHVRIYRGLLAKQLTSFYRSAGDKTDFSEEDEHS